MIQINKTYSFEENEDYSFFNRETLNPIFESNTYENINDILNNHNLLNESKISDEFCQKLIDIDEDKENENNILLSYDNSNLEYNNKIENDNPIFQKYNGCTLFNNLFSLKNFNMFNYASQIHSNSKIHEINVLQKQNDCSQKKKEEIFPNFKDENNDKKNDYCDKTKEKTQGKEENVNVFFLIKNSSEKDEKT